MKNSSENKSHPLIVLLGGGWSSGKSTLAIKLASDLNIANVIHTDVVRCCLRGIFGDQKDSCIKLSTYETWKDVSLECTEHSLSEGFLRQCQVLYPLIKHTIEEAIDFGKDTIIEGMHLHPALYKTFSATYGCKYFWLFFSDKYFEKRVKDRCRCNYKNRDHKKYLTSENKGKITMLNSSLLENATKLGVCVIDNTEYNAGDVISQYILGNK